MKGPKFIIFLLYKAWSYGNFKDIAYTCALFTLVFFVWFNVTAATGILGMSPIIPYNSSDSKLMGYFKISWFFIPAYFILNLLFKKKEIIVLEYDKRTLKKGYIGLLIYGILSLMFFILSAEWKLISYMWRINH